METNRTYRRHVSTARFGYNSNFVCSRSLLDALSDSRGSLIDYRCTSLGKCLSEKFPCFRGFNFSKVLSDELFLSNLVLSLRLDYNISAIEFYSNGDIKLHFFPYKYICL